MINSGKKRKVNLWTYILLFFLLSGVYFICVLILYAIPYFGWEIVFEKKMPSPPDFIEYGLWIFVVGASIITLRRKFSLKSSERFSIKQDFSQFNFSSNRSLVILFVGMCIAIFYLGARVNSLSLNVENTNTEDTKEQILIKGCTRTERYKNLPEYDNALTLIEDRLGDWYKWYGKEGFARNVISIIPCIVVIEDKVRKEREAEGYFIFGGEGVNPNYLPIYVDFSYRKQDTLLTASLMVHEMIHAWQFIEAVNGKRDDCYNREVIAFLGQFDFLRAIKYEEGKYLYYKIKYDLYPHPQIVIMDYLLNSTLGDGKDIVCDENESKRFGGREECALALVTQSITRMVKENPFYQKQCVVNKLSI